jgi:sec-independent protein translocase protein TatA
MGGLSPLHWMLVLLVVVLLFGTGRISSVMGDFAKGLKAFKKNMADENDVSMEASERPGERPAGSIAAPNVPNPAAAPPYAAPASAAPVTPPQAAAAPPAQPTTVDHV